MYSDNGTNFVGANKELMNIQEVREDEERSRRPHHNLEVHTSRRSEHGWRLGALVRSVKTALAATLREEPSRRSSPHPAARSRAHCQLQTRATDDNVLLGPANWRTCQRLADHFWQRWLREYLPTLVPRRARRPICRAPAEGDIVLIVDSSSPRYSWPRGRIKKTYPGPDNQVRVVDVETTGGVLRRPTSKIVVLVSAEATAVPLGVVHPTQLLANRHLVKLGLIKSERKRCPLLTTPPHCKKSADHRRSVRIVKRGNPGCGLTRR
ncbi:hypothetical protein EVAR_74673_1 [Eumeta japonica]|uniref:DUF5641 domain-containing protein n=1 Tax=Eumeta variegata TaxID=151549 RepID=A0A4C1TJS9_EUMVA|nr:hypothetical protein EVAR_74673_1 [Eumeta japonica]